MSRWRIGKEGGIKNTVVFFIFEMYLTSQYRSPGTGWCMSMLTSIFMIKNKENGGAFSSVQTRMVLHADT
jgi:hypothetical protein